MLLDASGICGGTETGNQGILGIIFKVAAAEGIPLDVHARRKPEGHAEFLHFFSHNVAGFFHCLHVPGLGQQGGDVDGRAVLIIIYRVGGALRTIAAQAGTAYGAAAQAGNRHALGVGHKVDGKP